MVALARPLKSHARARGRAATTHEMEEERLVAVAQHLEEDVFREIRLLRAQLVQHTSRLLVNRLDHVRLRCAAL